MDPKTNRQIFAYGGDWQPTDEGAAGGAGGGGEMPSDSNFCINGLVQPDRRLSPATAEVKKVYEPVHVEFGHIDLATAMVQLKISNRFAFRDLSHLRMYWTILANGEPSFFLSPPSGRGAP